MYKEEIMKSPRARKKEFLFPDKLDETESEESCSWIIKLEVDKISTSLCRDTTIYNIFG